jgi:hypothetical protein
LDLPQHLIKYDHLKKYNQQLLILTINLIIVLMFNITIVFCCQDFMKTEDR